jgi:hypothetical protein
MLPIPSTPTQTDPPHQPPNPSMDLSGLLDAAAGPGFSAGLGCLPSLPTPQLPAWDTFQGHPRASGGSSGGAGFPRGGSEAAEGAEDELEVDFDEPDDDGDEDAAEAMGSSATRRGGRSAFRPSAGASGMGTPGGGRGRGGRGGIAAGRGRVGKRPMRNFATPETSRRVRAMAAAAGIDPEADREHYRNWVLARAREVHQSTRVLPACPEPKRIKSHWDHVLEEMEWLSKDFMRCVVLGSCGRLWHRAAAGNDINLQQQVQPWTSVPVRVI